MPEREQTTIVIRERTQGVLEVQVPRIDLHRRVGRSMWDQPTDAFATQLLARFVGRNGQDPGPEASWIAKRLQAPPHLCPRRLGGVLGHLWAPTDEEAHPQDVRMMRGNDPRECLLVTVARQRDLCESGVWAHHVHAHKMRCGFRVQQG